jgi:hypothetical protein
MLFLREALLAGTLRYRDVTYQISGGSIPGSTYDVLAPASRPSPAIGR